MSLLDFFKRGDKESPENLGKVASETAVEFIKKLSGADIKRTKKVIDNIVVVSNAAGGAGASTVVSNVAHMMTKKGFRVLVIDLNILYPVQHSCFGVKQAIEKNDLASYLLGKTTIGESIDSTGDVSLMYANNRGLMDSINCESDASVKNFEIALSKLRQLFDVVLIDAPMRVDNTLVNTAFYLADQIYLVWDEGISSIGNTEKIRRNMAASGIESYTKMRVILNKKTSINYSQYPFQKLNIELAQILPFDIEIIESSLRSVVFCNKGASSSDTASAFYEGIVSLTDKILQNGGFVK